MFPIRYSAVSDIQQLNGISKSMTNTFIEEKFTLSLAKKEKNVIVIQNPGFKIRHIRDAILTLLLTSMYS